MIRRGDPCGRPLGGHPLICWGDHWATTRVAPTVCAFLIPGEGG